MQHVWAHASGAEGSLSAHMVGLASSDQGRTAGRDPQSPWPTHPLLDAG